MSASPCLQPPAWWENGAALRRVVADLLRAELALARPGRPLPAHAWDEDLDFVRDLGADSLELLGMGTALAEALQLARAAVDDRLLAAPRLEAWVACARQGLDALSAHRAAGGPDALAVTFRTSGSAGSPKRCTHALASLWQEARELAQLAPGRTRILSVVPAHHIYGFLFTVLLPHAYGSGAQVQVLDLRAASPATLLREARAGDLVVAHPGYWEQLARLAPRFGDGVMGVSSTAPCPDPLAACLLDAGLGLLQVYGSSETAGVGWRVQPGGAFTLLPYWSRAGAEHELLRRLPDGSEARYPLQDRLAWQDERRFLPEGRIDQAVQVGGTNVFPAYVAEVLCMHPAVLEASVRLMRLDEGRRLKAFVVPAGGHEGDPDALGAALAAWCAERLTPPERPVAFSFGDKLPRQASGKPADWIIEG